MTTIPSSPVARRRFLVRLSSAAAGMAALLGRPAALSAAQLPRVATGSDPDAWIDRLTGEQRVMIHAHNYFMTALVDARTMLATLTNGAARSGYIPHDAGFGMYTFEVLSSRLQPGCAESAIVNGILDLMTQSPQ